MFILALTSGVFVLIAIIVTINRILFEQRFTAIQQEPDQTVLFRRKVQYLKRIEQERHIRYLLLISLAISFGVLVFISSYSMFVATFQQMETKTVRMENRIQELEEKQTQLAVRIPLAHYPEAGIGLNDYKWDKLSEDGEESVLREEIEADISKKLSQYLGTSNTAISLALPKTMALHLKGQAKDTASQETIKTNIDAFVKEAEAVPELTQIQVQMVTSIDQKKRNIYSVNYSRENGDEDFKKKNVSEENLKNDGGKG